MRRLTSPVVRSTSLSAMVASLAGHRHFFDVGGQPDRDDGRVALMHLVHATAQRGANLVGLPDCFAIATHRLGQLREVRRRVEYATVEDALLQGGSFGEG